MQVNFILKKMNPNTLIPTLLVLSFLCFPLISLGMSLDSLSPLPIPPKTDDLKTALPTCLIPDTNRLSNLERCRGDLEAYRSGVLEGYNKKINRYVLAVKRIDSSLEQMLAQRLITKDDYIVRHQSIVAALEAAGVNGELMDEYFTYLAKYKELTAWVTNEAQKEKERRHRKELQPA